MASLISVLMASKISLLMASMMSELLQSMHRVVTIAMLPEEPRPWKKVACTAEVADLRKWLVRRMRQQDDDHYE